MPPDKFSKHPELTLLSIAIAFSSAAEGEASPVTSHKKPPKKKALLAVIIGFAVLSLLVFLWWYFIARFSESTNDAYLQADSVTLSPKISGNVSEVLIKDNQPVKAGQVLVRINDDQYLARVNEMQATMQANEAAIERATADITRQEAEIDRAKARQQSALVQLRYAGHEYQRYLPLAASGAEAKEQLADLRRSLDAAQADYNANVAAVRAASAQIQTLQAQIVQSKAQMASSKASLARSSIDLKDTLIRSPLDGVVGDRSVRVGQYVQPGTRLMTVVPTQELYLTANFKETQLARMRVGQPAILHVDSQPGHEFSGVVDSFSPGTGSQFALMPPENATGNFTKIVQRVPVKIRITDNSALRKLLLPGMSVTVDVDTHQQQQDPHS